MQRVGDLKRLWVVYPPLTNTFPLDCELFYSRYRRTSRQILQDEIFKASCKARSMRNFLS